MTRRAYRAGRHRPWFIAVIATVSLALFSPTVTRSEPKPQASRATTPEHYLEIELAMRRLLAEARPGSAEEADLGHRVAFYVTAQPDRDYSEALALSRRAVAFHAHDERRELLSRLLLRTGQHREAVEVAEALLADAVERLGRDDSRIRQPLSLFCNALRAAGDPRHDDHRAWLDGLSAAESVGAALASGRFADAAALARTQLEQASPGSIRRAELNFDWIAATLRSGEFDADQALRAAEETVDILRAHPDEPMLMALALRRQGAVLKRVGRWPDAVAVWERSLEILRRQLGDLNSETAIQFQIVGRGYFDIGDFDRALAFQELALDAREKISPDHHFVALSAVELGVLHAASGNDAEARRLLEHGSSRLAVRSGPQHRWTPEAEQMLAQWRLEAEQELARVLLRGGVYAQAQSLLEAVVHARRETLPDDHPDLANGIDALGTLFLERGDLQRAEPLLDEALALRVAAHGPEHIEVAESQFHLARLLVANGELERARELVRQVLRIRIDVLGPQHPDVARAHELLAELSLAAGQVEASLEHAERAEQIGREHLQLTARGLSERRALRYAEHRPRGLDVMLTALLSNHQPTWARRVWAQVAQSRALVSDEMAARRHSVATADHTLTERSERLAATRAQLANLSLGGLSGRTPADYRRLLDDARRLKERLEVELARDSQPFRDQQLANQITIDAIGSKVTPGAALVAYVELTKLIVAADQRLTSRPWYLALVVPGGERSPQVVDLGPAEPIELAVRAWRAEIATPPSPLTVAARSDEVDYRATSATLRELIWDPVAAGLESPDLVFVVPDGALHFVSLATLSGSDGSYLLESGPTFHYLSSERDLVRRGASSGRGLLAVGAPSHEPISIASSTVQSDTTTQRVVRRVADCARLRDRRWARLPMASRELREVADIFAVDDESEPLVLTGSSANEEAVKRLARGLEVVHVATHGFFVDRSCVDSSEVSPLLLSGLVLAPTEGSSASAAGEDGLLTADEIASIDLTGVRLIVLSACGSGLGAVQEGEGVLGLRRAFRIAGAESLLMSLWSVEDDATRTFMGAFYRARRAGDSIAAAARHAARNGLLEQRRRGLATHPYLWGAFVTEGLP